MKSISLRTLGTFVFLLMVCFTHLASFGDDWPQFRGVNRDGKTSWTGLRTNWRQKQPTWQRTLMGAGAGYGSLAVVDGKVYSIGNGESSQYVSCINLETTDIEWTTTIVNVRPNHFYLGSRSTPTYHRGKLYVVSSDGKLLCLNAVNGKILWEKVFQTLWKGRMMSGWGFSESPLVDDDQVVVTPGGEDAIMVALSLDGSERWRCKPTGIQREQLAQLKKLKSGAGYSSMQVAEIYNVRQYLQVIGKGLISVRASDGKLLWFHSGAANSIANINTPLVQGTHVLYSTAHGGGTTQVNVLEVGTPQNTIRQKIEETFSLESSQAQCHHGGLILHNGYVYFGHGMNKGFPTCLDWNTCKVRWGREFRGPGNGSAAVIYCDGCLIFRYQNGVTALIKADPKRYQLLGSFKQKVKSNNKSWSHPVLVDGQLLLRENDRIMVYDVRAN